jgi:hypothetical protein
VGRVLTGNGITAHGDGAYSLIGGDELSDTERDELLELCRQRLDAFREHRGEEVACLLVEKPAASATAKRAVCCARWRAAAGCCWRTSWHSASPLPTW